VCLDNKNQKLTNNLFLKSLHWLVSIHGDHGLLSVVCNGMKDLKE